jgi:hypothetical protein
MLGRPDGPHRAAGATRARAQLGMQPQGTPQKAARGPRHSGRRDLQVARVPGPAAR